MQNGSSVFLTVKIKNKKIHILSAIFTQEVQQGAMGQIYSMSLTFFSRINTAILERRAHSVWPKKSTERMSGIMQLYTSRQNTHMVWLPYAHFLVLNRIFFFKHAIT